MIENSNFYNNTVTNQGGGIYNAQATTTITGSNIYNNTANGGGGVFNTDCTVSIISSSIHNNNSTNDGAGINNFSATVDIINSNIYENISANYGGGIFNAGATVNIINSIIYNNSAAAVAGGVFINGTSIANVDNSIFWKNEQNNSAITAGSDIASGGAGVINVDYSMMQIHSGTNGMVGTDPLFINETDPDGADNIPGTADDGLQLHSSSPAIDAGNNSAISELTDMIGNSRTYNATVDMGSYEWNLSTLPVELLFFQGKAKENHNHLTWITASETNNRGFHLEHSTDGRDFQEIAWIEGNGTTIEESQYDYLHKNPESYINYYRLLQEDHDGNTEYSKVIHIDNKGKKTIRIYPNPTFNILNIEVGDRNQALTVTDISGRTVLSYDNTPNQITLSDLPSGTYFIRVGKDIVRITKD